MGSSFWAGRNAFLYTADDTVTSRKSTIICLRGILRVSMAFGGGHLHWAATGKPVQAHAAAFPATSRNAAGVKWTD